MILVDTREQKPLWESIPGKIERKKLDEGDYTTTDLLNIAHVERKSGNDLYGSIIQGHNRFRDELKRAQAKNLTLSVFVECTKAEFIGKKFKGGYLLKCKPKVIAKILKTIEQKYNVDFVWCEDREDMSQQILKWFEKQRRCLNHAKITSSNEKIRKQEIQSLS